MGRSSRSPVAGPNDARWDRDARQQSTDFVLGTGLRPNRQGRTEVAISSHPDSRLTENEFGEIEVLIEPVVPSQGPAAITSVSEDTAVIELQQSVTRLTKVLREQGLVI